MASRSVSSTDVFGSQPPPHPAAGSADTIQTDVSTEPTIVFDQPLGHQEGHHPLHRRGLAEEHPATGEPGAPPDPGSGQGEGSAPTITIRSPYELTSLAEKPIVSPIRGHELRKALVATLFWAVLVATLAMWWFNTSTSAVRGHGGVLLAAGRITGLMSGFVLLAAILSKARLRWIESWFGAYELRTWRATLVRALVVLTIAHVVLLSFGYAQKEKDSALNQAWQMLTTMEGMITAALATVVLIVVAVFSTRPVRARLPFELTHFFRMGLYGVLFLAYGHQFALGTVIRPGLARWYWISLHLVVLGSLLWGRVLRPAWFNGRHEFTVSDVVSDESGWVTIDIGGRQLDWVHAEVGQHTYCRFLTEDCWWQAHPFSIAETPDGQRLRIKVKAVGHFTRALHELEPGEAVLLSEPTGAVTASRRITEQALVIAGGTGVAPVVALIQELPAGTVLLYFESSESELAFQADLRRLVAEREAKVISVTGSGTDHSRRALSPTGLRELVPDLAERDVFVFGPRRLVKQSAEALRWLRVPRKQVHLESFEL